MIRTHADLTSAERLFEQFGQEMVTRGLILRELPIVPGSRIVRGVRADLRDGSHLFLWILTERFEPGMLSLREKCTIDLANGGSVLAFSQEALGWRVRWEIQAPWRLGSRFLFTYLAPLLTGLPRPIGDTELVPLDAVCCVSELILLCADTERSSTIPPSGTTT